MKSILLTGGTGFIGQPLVRALASQGYDLSVLTRDPVVAQSRLPANVRLYPRLDALEAAGVVPDVLINLAGESLANKRWSAASKAEFRTSRIGLTEQLVDCFERMGKFPARVVSGSAIGFYGDRGDAILDEQQPPGNDFAALLCRDWERAAALFSARGSSVCYLRTGIVLGAEGGALKQMLPAFRMGLGGPMGSGKQYMSWIHREDMVRLVLFLVEEPDIIGPVNAVSPNPVSNKEFATTLGHLLHRPAVLAVPSPALKLMFGEMASSLLLASQRVLPGCALARGFTFQHPLLMKALENLLKK